MFVDILYVFILILYAVDLSEYNFSGLERFVFLLLQTLVSLVKLIMNLQKEYIYIDLISEEFWILIQIIIVILQHQLV
jgi:hypothetical protein